LNEKLDPGPWTCVCTDTVNAKPGDVVLTCSSSSARLTAATRDVCTDNTIVAIVDIISEGKSDVYRNG
jgi:microcompartment protein CcmK/EutM